MKECPVSKPKGASMDWSAVGNALATGLAVGGGFLGMAWKADGLLSDEIKEDISLWLLCAEPKTAERYAHKWPKYISTLFDQIFSEKHLSWKCFRRSCVASIVALLISTAVFFQLAPHHYTTNIESVIAMSLVIFFIGLILNLAPDYLSLLETRFVIKKLQSSKGMLTQILWITIDFILTSAIIFLPVFISSTAILAASGTDYPGSIFAAILNLIYLMYEIFIFRTDEKTLLIVVFIWTTFFTSIWVWLYFFAQFLSRLLKPIRPSVKFLQYALPIEKHPLRSVGAVMGFLACIITWAVLIPQVM